MKALLILALILVLAAGAGATVLEILRIEIRHTRERMVYGIPLGLGIIGHLVLVLGLAGQLALAPIVLALLILCALSVAGFKSYLLHIGVTEGDSQVEIESYLDKAELAKHTPGPRWLSTLTALTMGLVGIIVLINCYVPPAGHEWDALSYHLAAPKVFIQHHRIIYLPTDHHSNFPFTMEMLFTLGLLFSGFALANLMHFATFALSVCTVLWIGKRHLVPGAGALAAVTLATTPIVIWESGAAYIEMGLALFVLLCVGSALEYRRNENPRWLWLAGIFMGLALSVKALALLPFALIAFLLAAARVPVRRLCAFVMVAMVIGSPYYIKSWVWTRNPVYPFAYSVFKDSRDWNSDLAAGYALEQKGFGQSHQRTGVSDDLRGLHAVYAPPSVGERIHNLITAPFDLIAVPRIFYNYNDPGIHAQIGFLCLSFPPLILLTRRVTAGSRWIAVLAALWFVAWSESMQYVRYLVPMVPMLALAGSEGAARLVESCRAFGVVLLSAILIQLYICVGQFGMLLPDQLRRAINSDARQDYLSRTVDVYQAEQWINANTPHNVGVVLFEDTRGLYLDRPYLWGNSPHSLYIPYDRFNSGREMTDWFRTQGILYALINLKFTPGHESVGDRDLLVQASMDGAEARLALEWYSPNTPGEKWRRLLGDALTSGAAVVIPEACSHRVVVVEFRATIERTAP